MAGAKMASVVVLALCLLAGIAHGKLVTPQDDANNWEYSVDNSDAGEPMLTEGAGNGASLAASGYDLFEDTNAQVFDSNSLNPNLHQFAANTFDDDDQAVTNPAESYSYDARSQETGYDQFSTDSGTVQEGTLVGSGDVGSDGSGDNSNPNSVDSFSSYDATSSGNETGGRLVGTGEAESVGVHPTEDSGASLASNDVSSSGTEEFATADKGILLGTGFADVVGAGSTSDPDYVDSFSSHDVSSAGNEEVGTADAGNEEGRLVGNDDASLVGAEQSNYDTNSGYSGTDSLAVERNPEASTVVLGDPEVRDPSTTQTAVVNPKEYTFDAHGNSLASSNQEVGTIFAHEAVSTMATDANPDQVVDHSHYGPSSIYTPSSDNSAFTFHDPRSVAEQNQNPIVGPDSNGGATSFATVNPLSVSDSTTATTTPIVAADKLPAGTHGCPNSYWAAHTEQWPQEITIATTVVSVFGEKAGIIYGTTTIFQALLDSRDLAFSKLLRHAAAALLNAYAMPDYTIKVTDVVTQFQSALGSDSTAVVQAQKFENANKAYGSNECAN